MAVTDEFAAQAVEAPARGKAGKQLPLFEGKRYPDVELRLAGGMTGDAEFLLPDVTGRRIGEAFHLVVHGMIVSKKHALTFDKDGEEKRTLVVTLKVDDVDEPSS